MENEKETESLRREQEASGGLSDKGHNVIKGEGRICTLTVVHPLQCRKESWVLMLVLVRVAGSIPGWLIIWRGDQRFEGARDKRLRVEGECLRRSKVRSCKEE